MARDLRLGLIGAGRWGRNYIKTIAALPGMRLARLASGNPESARLVDAGCAIEGDWRAMLECDDLDAVIVATPPALHASMVEASVARGLPVLVEKPLTMDLAQASALRDFVAARAGFVMVDHTHLFHPAYRALKEAAPRYGAIRAIRCDAGNVGPFRAHTPVLWDWGPHDVALCLDLLGALPDRVDASLVECRDTPEGRGEVVEIRASFPQGAAAVLRFGNLMPRTRRLAAYLDRGVLVYDDLAPSKLVAHPPAQPLGEPPGTGEPLPHAAQLPLACVVSEFAAAVEAGERSLRDLDLGVEVVRVLQRCQAAMDRDR